MNAAGREVNKQAMAYNELDKKETKIFNNSRWYLSVSFLVAIILIFPYLVAYINTPVGMVFNGFILNSVDNFTYLSKMQNAVEGWSFINNYSPLARDGGYHFLFYILSGKIALLFHIPFIIMFHISRIAASMFLLWSLYKFIAIFQLSDKLRRLMFLVGALGSSNEFFLLSGNILNSDQTNFIFRGGARIPELLPSTTMLYYPHIILIFAFQLQVWRLVNNYAQSKIKTSLQIGLYLLLMALIHPFTSVFTGFGCAMYLCYLLKKAGSLKLNTLYPISFFGLIPLPYLIYSYHAFQTLPTLILWEKNMVPPQSVFENLILTICVVGLPFIFLFLILIFDKWSWSEERKILAWWITFCVISSILPLFFAKRLLEGVGAPVLLLVVWWLIEKYPNKKIAYALLTLMCINTIYLTFEPLIIIDKNLYSYQYVEQREAYDWMHKNLARNSLVFTDKFNGNIIPGTTGIKVVVGHKDESPNYEESLKKWDELTANNVGLYPEIKRMGVDYIFYENRFNGNKHIDFSKKFYQAIYVNKDITIYKVK